MVNKKKKKRLGMNSNRVHHAINISQLRCGTVCCCNLIMVYEITNILLEYIVHILSNIIEAKNINMGNEML